MSKIQTQTIGSIDGTYEIDVKDIQPIGVGQTWQSVISQRDKDIEYVNDTGRPIMVNIGVRRVPDSSETLVSGRLYVNNALVSEIIAPTSNNYTTVNYTGIVPPGATYEMASISGSENRTYIYTWSELR